MSIYQSAPMHSESLDAEGSELSYPMTFAWYLFYRGPTIPAEHAHALGVRMLNEERELMKLQQRVDLDTMSESSNHEIKHRPTVLAVP